MDRILTPETIRIVSDNLSREAAIDAVGQLLHDVGAVSSDYITSMHERERSVSTYMGNFLAIPHGTNEAKDQIQRTALAVLRTDSDIDWGGNPVRFVIGIAGIGDEHLALLSNIAVIFSDAAAVEQLLDASADELFTQLAGVNA